MAVCPATHMASGDELTRSLAPMNYRRIAGPVSVAVVALAYRAYDAAVVEPMAAALRASQVATFPGRTAVVVGATSGIGRGCAYRLAEAGYRVVAVGRDPVRGQAVVDTMAGTGHEFIPCDAFSLKAVKRCAAEISAKHPKLDALVLSQGMATLQGFTPTPDGNDEKLSLHYWSRMGFTGLLLPALRDGTEPRVISVLSGGVHSAFAKWAEDPELKKGSYSIKNAADAGGFYNDLGLDHLARADGNDNVVFVHACPGFVKTAWGTEMPWALRVVIRGLQFLGKSPEDCAEEVLAPIFQSREELAPASGEHRGVVIMGDRAVPCKPTAGHTAEARDSVWRTTQDVLRRAGIEI